MGAGEAPADAGPLPAAPALHLMRIIAGVWRGRRLVAPRGRAVRPSSDRLRETLFDMLVHGPWPALAGARLADLFAGTGALGLEALSRGAAHATFVEIARPALETLGRNIEALGAGGRARILARDARRLPPAEAPCDIAFLDPPYGKGLEVPALAALRAGGWLAPGAVAVVETAPGEPLAAPGFACVAERKAGSAYLRFLRPG